MGQLVKLQDYVSRYEADAFRYAGQYIRLKKQHWDRVKGAWENGTLPTLSEMEESNWLEDDKEKKRFPSFKNVFKRNKNTELEAQQELLETRKKEETDDLYTFPYLPANIEELKRMFLENLFTFQMKWASSTIRDKSYVERNLYRDDWLKFFLQRFPDTYLLLYKPVFMIKSAPVEVDYIFISPTCVWCITKYDGVNSNVLIGSNEHFWVEKVEDREKKLLNPLLSLNRMGSIVKNIFTQAGVEFPIKKVFINENGFIDYPEHPYDIQFVEKRNFDEWFQQLRGLSSPLKFMQLKATQALLNHCQSIFVRRPEWESDENDIT